MAYLTENPEQKDEAAHLETFRAADLEDDAPPPDDVLDVDENGDPVAGNFEPEQISKEAFWTVFKQAFSLPGMFAQVWKPLAIQPDEQEAGRAASDAIYELLEIYFPGALLPQSDTLARLLACVPFLMAKVIVVRAIMADRNRPVEAPSEFKSRRRNPEPTAQSPSSWMDQEQEAAAA